jgi:hypothetical protein
MNDGNTSINDLLSHEEEAPAEERPARSGLGWLVKTILYAAALAALGVLGLRVLASVAMPYLLAFTIALALLVLRRLVRLVATGDRWRDPVRSGASRATAARRAAALDDEASYHWDNVDGLRAAVSRWEHRLEHGSGVPSRLTELAGERLRQRHGITLSGDPVRARELLGEPLWTMLNSPAAKPPTPRQLAAVAAGLEEL